jgi:hypothetical protein
LIHGIFDGCLVISVGIPITIHAIKQNANRILFINEIIAPTL